MQDNWYALIVSILKGVLPEQAFELMENNTYKPLYGSDHTSDMIKMHEQGMTYRDIGEIYGISESAICKRIKHIKKPPCANRCGKMVKI